MAHSQNQLTLVSALQVGNEFKDRYKGTVGSVEDLDPLLKRYPKYEMSPDGTRLAVFDKKLTPIFTAYDRQLLVADVRRKETRKPNCHGKARAKRQTSYR